MDGWIWWRWYGDDVGYGYTILICYFFGSCPVTSYTICPVCCYAPVNVTIPGPVSTYIFTPLMEDMFPVML